MIIIKTKLNHMMPTPAEAYEEGYECGYRCAMRLLGYSKEETKMKMMTTN